MTLYFLYNSKSEIWSFGCCLLHIATNERPYKNIKTIIAYGEAREQIITALGDAVRSIKKIGLNSAVQKAHSIAKPGDIVLLSPGCASFDQFENFESRGDFFKSVIEKIA